MQDSRPEAVRQQSKVFLVLLEDLRLDHVVLAGEHNREECQSANTRCRVTRRPDLIENVDWEVFQADRGGWGLDRLQAVLYLSSRVSWNRRGPIKTQDPTHLSIAEQNLLLLQGFNLLLYLFFGELFNGTRGDDRSRLGVLKKREAERDANTRPNIIRMRGLPAFSIP